MLCALVIETIFMFLGFHSNFYELVLTMIFHIFIGFEWIIDLTSNREITYRMAFIISIQFIVFMWILL